MSEFEHLGLSPKLLPVIKSMGYEAPTDIQRESIPIMLNGDDLLAQAQTGTGKTAAFALPILSRIEPKQRAPQALVITPTRELAIQVADAFSEYAKNFKDLKVSILYGGQDYRGQLRTLRDGAQVVIGTPGRLLDHVRRGSLDLQQIKTVVLDEADEMLKMGFIDSVEWLFDQMSHDHQTALFSATIPGPIKKIAARYLEQPQHVHIAPKERTTSNIEQSYIFASRKQKFDYLTRYLEVEDIQASIIFTRTKSDSTELAALLQSKGYKALALNGDMRQEEREKVINRMRRSVLDIIVATDVAARGIDVERISHVINYDIPFDTESYIHRIGRTGRAGRKGKALLFVSARDKRMLNDIERKIKCQIKEIAPASQSEINQKRTEKLTDRINEVIKDKRLKPYRRLVLDIFERSERDLVDIAAALAFLNLGHKPTAKTDEPNLSDEPKRKIVKRKIKKSSNKKTLSTKKPLKKRTKFKDKKAKQA